MKYFKSLLPASFLILIGCSINTAKYMDNNRKKTYTPSPLINQKNNFIDSDIEDDSEEKNSYYNTNNYNSNTREGQNDEQDPKVIFRFLKKYCNDLSVKTEENTNNIIKIIEDLNNKSIKDIREKINKHLALPNDKVPIEAKKYLIGESMELLKSEIIKGTENKLRNLQNQSLKENVRLLNEAMNMKDNVLNETKKLEFNIKELKFEKILNNNNKEIELKEKKNEFQKKNEKIEKLESELKQKEQEIKDKEQKVSEQLSNTNNNNEKSIRILKQTIRDKENKLLKIKDILLKIRKEKIVDIKITDAYSGGIFGSKTDSKYEYLTLMKTEYGKKLPKVNINQVFIENILEIDKILNS